MAKQRRRQKFVHLMKKKTISARNAHLARAIFHSDAYFREVIKVIEKLQDVCLTFFNKYNSSATLAQSWKRARTDSVRKCQTFRFLTILTCLMITEIA